MRRKWLWIAAVAGFVFTLAGAQPARADHGDRQQECWRKIEKEEHKLDKEIRKHGWRSRQAQRQRDKIAQLNRQCGFNNGYGWGRDRDRRDDDRWGRDRDRREDDRRRRDRDYNDPYYDNRGYNNHDPAGCRSYDHRHDRNGLFQWFNGRWARRR